MTTPHDSIRLSPADTDALDALVEAEFDLDRVPPFLRARAERIALILGLLEPVEASESSPAALHEPALCALDGAAMDALVANGWSASRAPSEFAWRAGKIDSILDVLKTPCAAEREIDGEALIDATLVRIERMRRAASAPAAIRLRPLARFRLADLASAAAIVLIATAILWPMMTGIRRDNIRTANAVRMSNAGLGFNLYANDHNGRLPSDQNSLAGRAPGVVWWNVGEPNHSHSAHLFVLVKQGYASLEDLASPANPHAPIRLDLSELNDWRTSEEVSYSYQLLGRGIVQWSTPSRQVVLSDRSPVIEQARMRGTIDATLNSFQHRGAGQHVLFNDRSVQWLDSPITAWGDNIWLPRSLERRLNATLYGVELPDGRDDAFVGP